MTSVSVRLWLLAALLLVSAGQVEARQRWWGYCGQGGQKIFTTGQQSTTYALATYPSCTVTVYLAGTVTLASIYSDNSGTVKANPFTADTKAFVFFYASQGRYDVRYSGGGLASPTTISDVYLNDAGGPIGPQGIQGIQGVPGVAGPTGTGSAPYQSESFTAQTSKVVLATTHAQGVAPFAACLDDSVPAVEVACNKEYSSNGDVTFTWFPAFSGSVRIIGGGSGQQGPPGPSGMRLTTTYAFTPQTPGGTLSVTVAATVTLAPCPLGVNGTDVLHSYYISGGTGTAEAVLGTGGTCTSGAASGTLIFTPANNHSGAWTIQSATAGIRECFVVAGTNGACYTPAGTYNYYATIYNDQMVTWFGDGSVTTVQQQFTGDGIVIGPTSYTGGFISTRNIRHQYGLGFGTFATSGTAWTFRNVGDGEVSGLETILGYVGFKFAGSVRVKYFNLYSNANSIAYHWSSANPGNAGWFSNVYGTVQANGILALFDPNIIGLSISNFLLEAAAGAPGAGTIGIQLNQTAAGPINELVISNGFVDSIGTHALLVNYTATGGQNISSTIHLNNIRFTSVGSSATALLSAPMFGFNIAGNTFANGGTGDAMTVSGLRNSIFTGNFFDVATAGGRGIVVQAAAGGEVNTDLNFVGNTIGFNGAATPTNAIATDAAAHTGLRFTGNKVKGGIAWSATGAANAFDISDQFLPALTFSTLPSFSNGASLFCSDCNSTCTAGASTGRTCFRENDTWTH